MPLWTTGVGMFETEPNWAIEIRAYRLRRTLTQDALACTLGVDTTTISRWERGRDKPSLSVQKHLRRLLTPAEGASAQGLRDIIDATGDIAVLMDRQYRLVHASAAHRKLLRYDLSDVAGVHFPMWTEAMHATMAPIGGPEGWWKNGIRRISFNIMRKPLERAANPKPIYQRITTLTVRDSAGEPFRFAITKTIKLRDYVPRLPEIEYF
jgi:transcriptional regulator with XRE-family HTH domain